MFCYCEQHCPDGSHNGTCELKPLAQCFAAVEEVYHPETGALVSEYTYGCLPPDESGLMQCKSTMVPHSAPQSIECCRSRDLCNKDLNPMYDLAPYEVLPSFPSSQRNAMILIGTLALSAVLLAGFALTLFITYRRRVRKRALANSLVKEPFLKSRPKKALQISSTVGYTAEPSSGSGSGSMHLVQRTIGRQIEMLRVVGRGRFGAVWQGRWRGTPVAVKVFYTTEEASWVRESEVYQIVLLRHENILGYIASDIKGTGSWTEMIVVTEFHPLGSLYDYLQVHSVSGILLVSFAYSIASGLAHLHMEIFGTQGKPAIAHRDIKSRNILVKRNGTCCIADFGLAVQHSSEAPGELPSNVRVGTKRYMSPELLSESMPPASFEAFKQCDMYSFALVLWEIVRRVKQDDLGEEYQPPYFDFVGADPSFEEMAEVVCTRGLRPNVPKKWTEHEPRATIAKLMQELWTAIPSARLPALRVKKNLSLLVEERSPTQHFLEAENAKFGQQKSSSTSLRLAEMPSKKNEALLMKPSSFPSYPLGDGPKCPSDTPPPPLLMTPPPSLSGPSTSMSLSTPPHLPQHMPRERSTLIM